MRIGKSRLSTYGPPCSDEGNNGEKEKERKTAHFGREDLGMA